MSVRRSLYCVVVAGALSMLIRGEMPRPQILREPKAVETRSRGRSGYAGGGDAHAATRAANAMLARRRHRQRLDRIAFTFPMQVFYLAARATQQPNFPLPMLTRTP